LDPDDVREVLVLAPHVDAPIRARLVEFESEVPLTIEALKYVLRPFADYSDEALARVLPTVFPERLEQLREGRVDADEASLRASAEAATQTAQQDARPATVATDGQAGKKDANPFSDLSKSFDFKD
jgi:hypothetical protein